MKLTEIRDSNFQGRMFSVKEKLKGSDTEIAAYTALAQLWFEWGFELGARAVRERFIETVTEVQREIAVE